MARFRLVYRGPDEFAVLDLEKPQKGHPKDSWVPNGMLVEIFSNLSEATKELDRLNGPKRKNKKQNTKPKRSFRNSKPMGKSFPVSRPK